MQRAKNKRSAPDTSKLIEGFTTGQLVIGMCAALFVMCMCFLAGIAVGRISSDEQVAVVTTPSKPISQEDSAAAAAQRDRGKSRSSSTGTSAKKPAPSSEKTNTVSARTNTGAKKTTQPEVVAKNSGGRVTKMPPLPPAKEKPPTKPVLQLTHDASPPPATKKTPEPPAPKPAKPAAAPTVAKKEPVPEKKSALPPTQVAKNAAPAAVKPIPEPAKPAPKPPATTTPKTPAKKPVLRGNFGIQVASLQGTDREADSKSYVRRLAKGGYNAEVIPSDDGRYYRVIIVGYNDRVSAVASCKTLREKAAFYDAWVIALP